MGLIKSTNLPTSVSPFSMADVERQAKAVLLRAQAKAEQLFSAAQAEGQLIKTQARNEGLREGFEQGRVEGFEAGRKAGHQDALNEHRQSFTQATQSLSAALVDFDRNRANFDSSAAESVVKLSLAIAARVTKRQAALDPAVLLANVREAAKLVVRSCDVRIAVHPRQRQTLEAALPDLKLEIPVLGHAAIVEDTGISPGGCRVYTEHGQIDATIDEQLNRIAAELLPALQPGTETA